MGNVLAKRKEKKRKRKTKQTNKQMSIALIHQEHACNGGHLNFQSFAEYTRHLILAPEG
jgi:hypothetical protein